MAWSVLSADRPLPNEGALRFGVGAAAVPMWAPFMVAAGAGVFWWWATAWTRTAAGSAPASPTARRVEVSGAPVSVSPAPQPKTLRPALPTPAEAAEVAADVRAVAALETAPLHSEAEAVKAAVAEVVAAGGKPGGDGSRPARRKSGPKATV